MRSSFHLAIAVGGLLVSGCEKKRIPSLYLIPESYEGVVVTVWGEDGFEPLPEVDGFLVHKYPSDGILITSSEAEFGWAADDCQDLHGDKTRTPLPREVVGKRSEIGGSFGEFGHEQYPSIEASIRVIGLPENWENSGEREYKKAVEAMMKVKRLRVKSQIPNKTQHHKSDRDGGSEA